MLILCKKGSGWFIGRIVHEYVSGHPYNHYIENEHYQRMSADDVHDIEKVWILSDNDEVVPSTLDKLGF